MKWYTILFVFFSRVKKSRIIYSVVKGSLYIETFDCDNTPDPASLYRSPFTYFTFRNLEAVYLHTEVQDKTQSKCFFFSAILLDSWKLLKKTLHFINNFVQMMINTE